MKVYVVYYYAGMPCVDKVFTDKDKAKQRVAEQEKAYRGAIHFEMVEREVED